MENSINCQYYLKHVKYYILKNLLTTSQSRTKITAKNWSSLFRHKTRMKLMVLVPSWYHHTCDRDTSWISQCYVGFWITFSISFESHTSQEWDLSTTVLSSTQKTTFTGSVDLFCVS